MSMRSDSAHIWRRSHRKVTRPHTADGLARHCIAAGLDPLALGGALLAGQTLKEVSDKRGEAPAETTFHT